MIETRHIVKKYGPRTVVNDVSINMKKGEVVGLLGPNGAGKTTTFYMIIGLIKPDSGHVYLDDMDITKMPMYIRARNGLGYLPQESSIFKKLTVEENIMMIWELVGTIPKREYRDRLDQLLQDLNLTHIRHAKGIELSGGERRRVEIMRALATNPSFILLDEPFAGIDPIAVHDIQNIIKSLKDRGLGVIITDHNVRETLRITDRAYILHDGKILLSGAANEIATNEMAKRMYLGEGFTL